MVALPVQRPDITGENEMTHDLLLNADGLLRQGTKSKDVAAASGFSQHGFYAGIKKLGAQVACFTFLVDKDGLPLQPIELVDIEQAGIRATQKNQ